MGYDDEARGIRRRGGNGCLWYTLIFLIVMLLLSLMFGGFHKGKPHPNGLRPVSMSGIAPIAAPAF